MKFTPGPWEMDGLFIEAENGFRICSVNCPHTRGKEGMEDFEYATGNAKLIASAPDMYEALKRYVKIVDMYESLQGDLLNHATNEARNIIKQVGE